MNENEFKNFANLIKSDLKKELIKHYDTVKSEIDIVAQQILCFQLAINPDDTNLVAINRVKTEREKILEVNLRLIKLVESLLEQNLKEIDAFFANEAENCVDLLQLNKSAATGTIKEEIKSKALTVYCYFTSKANLKNDFVKLVLLGVLIVTDWYLDENQINYLRFSHELDLEKKFTYDKV
jgi:hypothetical protein